MNFKIARSGQSTTHLFYSLITLTVKSCALFLNSVCLPSFSSHCIVLSICLLDWWVHYQRFIPYVGIIRLGWSPPLTLSLTNLNRMNFLSLSLKGIVSQCFSLFSSSSLNLFQSIRRLHWSLLVFINSPLPLSEEFNSWKWEAFRNYSAFSNPF